MKVPKAESLAPLAVVVALQVGALAAGLWLSVAGADAVATAGAAERVRDHDRDRDRDRDRDHADDLVAPAGALVETIVVRRPQ